VDWLWSRRNLQQQGSKRNRGGEGEGVGSGLDKPLDFLATSGERISARLLTSDFGNSTPVKKTPCIKIKIEYKTLFQLPSQDMFDFDNMGFTNTVEHIKFLSCGDCEVGPLGYHNLQTRKSYLALARISYTG